MTPHQDGLPALPEPVDEIAQADGFNVVGTVGVFTADQMRDYARAAIANFLDRSGQYLTNDASREAAIAEAVKAAPPLPVQGGEEMPASFFAGMSEDFRKEAWRIRIGAHPNAQPASPERKPLTDEQIKALYHSSHWWELGQYPFTWGAASVVIRAAEAAHGIAATQEPRT